MAYTVTFTAHAAREFDKLEKQQQQRISNALERVRIRPEAFLTKLVGDDHYRLRVGDYRVIVDLLHKELIVLVLRIGHRSVVYDQ